jgi:hypothetical protein
MNRCFRFLAAATAVALSMPLASLSAAPGDLVATVKLPPLKTLTEKLLHTARTVKPGQETEMGALFILGPLGYPTFPGVSAEAPISIFVFEPEAGMPPPFVVMGKVEADAPIRQSLPSMGILTEDKGGYMLAGSAPSAFELVSDPAALAKLTQSQTFSDVVVTYQQDLSNLQSAIRDGMDSLMLELADEIEEAESKDKAEALIQVVEASAQFLLQDISEPVFSIDLGKEAVTFGTSVHAKPGSHLAQAITSELTQQVNVADVLKKGNAMNFVIRWEPTVVEQYAEQYLSYLEKKLPEETAQQLRLLAQAYFEFLQDFDGTSAASLSFQEPDMVTYGSIYGGEIDPDQCLQNLSKLLDRFNNQANAWLPKGWVQSLSIDLTPEFAELKDGTPVAQYALNLEFADRVDAELQATLDESNVPTYFTIVNGLYLEAQSPELLQQMASDVVSGEVADSIGKSMSLRSGEVMRGTIDVFNMMRMANAEEPDADLEQFILMLEGTQLPELSLLAKVDGERATSSFSVPLAFIAEMVKLSQSGPAAMQMEEDSY